MSEAFIVRRGGGAPYAVIGVEYPEGSVCTCTDGTRTFTARDTSGTAMFQIPSIGTWTVTATNGTLSKSKTVEITARGQVEVVELAYELVLFSANNEHTDITGGWQNSGTGGSASIGSTISLSIGGMGTTLHRVVNTVNTIDLSKYSILRAEVASCALSHSSCTARMYAGADTYVGITAGTSQVDLDISEMTDAREIRFRVAVTSGTAELEISKVTLL